MQINEGSHLCPAESGGGSLFLVPVLTLHPDRGRHSDTELSGVSIFRVTHIWLQTGQGHCNIKLLSQIISYALQTFLDKNIQYYCRANDIVSCAINSFHYNCSAVEASHRHLARRVAALYHVIVDRIIIFRLLSIFLDYYFVIVRSVAATAVIVHEVL